SASNRIIHAKDHASISLSLAELDEQTGRVTGNVKAYNICGCFVFVATSQPRDRFAFMLDRIYEDMPEVSLTGVRRGEVHLEHLDLSAMESVKKFADAFRQTKFHLNYLICNAGIMFAPRAVTQNGFESHLSVNYLGHCLLTMELLPLLKKTADKSSASSRIVNVSSATHFSTDFRFHDLQVTKYSAHQAYAQTKLAQVMFTYKLNRFLHDTLNWHNVQVLCLHPGVVLSDLYEHVGWVKYLPFLVPLIKLLTRDIVQGAETTLYATLSDELRGVSGVYLEDSAIAKSSRASRNVENQEKLWQVTNHLLEEWVPKSWIELISKN
ncbi:Short-chain dehydrogenase TIC 32, chloroplastic, partial [Fragariocoptes setiger]